MADFKHCCSCGVVKADSEFSRDRHRRDGLKPYCKACSKAQYKAAQARVVEANLLRTPDPSVTKHCHRCETVKPVAEFGKNRARADGLNVYCRECTKPLSRAHRLKRPDHYYRMGRAWLAAHPEVKRAQSKRDYERRKEKINAASREYQRLNRQKVSLKAKAYRAKNKEQMRVLSRGYKARKKAAAGSHTGEDIKSMFKAQRGRCAYCRTPLKPGYHVDHITALSKGGSNDRSNLQLLCALCNIKKKDADPIAFANRMGLLI